MRIFDLHNDFLTEKFNEYKNLIKSKNIIVNSAIYKGNLTFLKAYNLAIKLKNLNSSNLKLSFEDISFCDLDIEKLISLNPVSVSLTYNEENEFGYGVNENKGLKLRGLEIIKRLNNKDFYA